MGSFGDFFRKMVPAPVPEAPRVGQSAQSDDVAAGPDDWLTIDSLGFFGRSVWSPDATWQLANGQIHDSKANDWSSDDNSGAVLLLRDGRVVHQERGLCRPETVAVSDTGVSAIYEWGPSTQFLGPRCRLRVLNPDGSPVFEWRPGAAVDLMAMSPDGDYLAVTTLAAPEDSKRPEDGTSVIFVDLKKSVVVWRQPVPISRPASVGFDGDSHVVITGASSPDPLRFSFQGEFLDPDAAQRVRFSAASQDDRGYALLDVARSMLGDRPPASLEPAEATEIEAVLRQAIEKDISDYQRAGAVRLVGELAEARGDLNDALAQYRLALDLNPKIGLKRKIQALETATAN